MLEIPPSRCSYFALSILQFIVEAQSKEMGLVSDEGIEPPRLKPKWTRIKEIIWDGEREAEEKKLVQKLDIHLMLASSFVN